MKKPKRFLKKDMERKKKYINELKRQFEDDVAEIERKIKLIDGYSKVYVERVLNFKNKELSSEQRRDM